MRGVRAYLESQGYHELHGLPGVSGYSGACENIDALLRVSGPSSDFFSQPVYYPQSLQTTLEPLSQSMNRVWAVINSGRAESHINGRHSLCFTLIELEKLGSLDSLLTDVEALIKMAGQCVMSRCEKDLLSLGVDLTAMGTRLAKKFDRVEYKDAIKFLNDSGLTISYGDDLKPEHEVYLASKLGPHWIENWPLHLKFWNMKKNDGSDTVRSADLELVGMGESCGSAARETNFDKLEVRLYTSSAYKRMLEIEPETPEEEIRARFDWYLDFFKNHPKAAPHAGCGLGWSRVMASLLGLEDVRLSTPILINRGNVH
jgi:aspartyl/asparaginyl-tRNA synthetase